MMVQRRQAQLHPVLSVWYDSPHENVKHGLVYTYLLTHPKKQAP